ncbi:MULTISPECIES: DUF1259 domain-containing protein [unclassified Mesorhizobium]|uniref:DUF1259 domain-containing protein n=1 Tax=unclassified Mesorhizobium TaxID=325217 RepID=UPI000FCB5473|nr:MULTISPECIES: DUF1259 domain-containing protein [unclassified Mesorhizobium]RUV10077.1 DUF1259 domain-containing protein [Mesorhizobium sp. M1A.F.Ca.IN.022.04.1.1]RWG35580.1 MAG: DUF1259 domain-containing protein [Mesorhizobium sp.]TIM69738.1 MAG: DUF1259 domain-containing protein [Mesorhizobium sp.]TIS17520.1 MAG: DUF1259 domain-containing protein [Mesorhizobium sp.]
MHGKIIAGLAFAAAVGVAQPSLAAPDWKAVAHALGKSGQELSGGVYRVGLPRSDLKVTLDGVELKPALALGSWLAFKPMGDHDVMVMGDLVLTLPEIDPVMMKLVESGIEVTALHNHLQRAQPETMYMHVLGHGDPEKLAAALRSALQQSATPLSDAPASAAAASKAIDLNTSVIDHALGRKGKVNGGVYQVSIPRAETIKDDGMEVPDAMGSAIAINFQPTGEGKAAITGDFVLIASEVNPVLRALRESGIEVTAVHNHMLNDEPRLFFMHFWANDDVEKLAKGLKLALDQVHLRTGS